MSTTERLEQYVLLINQFVSGSISTSQFEVSYLDMFKSEKKEFPQDTYNVLNELFSDVDAYCGDPCLRDDEDLDDEQLLSRATEALKKLS